NPRYNRSSPAPAGDEHARPEPAHPASSRPAAPWAERVVRRLAASAGLEIGGPEPWDLQVHDGRFFGRVLRDGSLGLGESYMDGWWDAERLDETFYRLVGSDARRAVRTPTVLFSSLAAALVNKGRPSRAYDVGHRHYDLGNDLFEAMLDRRMVYTCGYWHEAATLDAAQEAKLDLVCRKLGLREGDRVLDVGCGWGSFLAFASERYGAHGVGVTVSEEQVALARERLQGLHVEVRLADYRAFEDPVPFDHVVSLGMFEHVDVKNYRMFMRVVRQHLRDDGLFLLHTIGSNRSVRTIDPWLERYIFPNSMLPSNRQIGRAIEGLFVMEDWHNFGAHYDRTLMAWYERFTRAWPDLRARYDERFRRMWTYYLLQCAGLFRARDAQLWQIVLSKDGVAGGYTSTR
ncbi:MAG: cyclopropane fatty acyl phospholipid synthase, partial [Rhodothermales bacterium]